MTIIGSIFLIILILIVLYSAYRLYVYKSGLPLHVYYNRNSKIAPLVSTLQVLHEKYHPTPWLFNGHLQSLYSMQLRRSKPFQNERERVTFSDGGEGIIDWFHPTVTVMTVDDKGEYAKKDDIIVLLHTLGGGSREKVINSIGVHCANNGYTAVCLNCRGCAGAKFTTKRVYNSFEIDDFKHTIDNYVKKRNPRHIFMIGFSMGSQQCTRYAAVYPDDLTAVVGVSHLMDLTKATKQIDTFPVNTFYLPNIIASHRRLLKKQPFLDKDYKEKLMKIDSMVEFDVEYTAPSVGMEINEFWKNVSIFDKIQNFGTPILELVAEDDPFTNKKFFPIDEAGLDYNQFMLLVTVKEGGHCGFIEGLDGEHSFVEDLAFEWFEKAAKMNIK